MNKNKIIDEKSVKYGFTNSELEEIINSALEEEIKLDFDIKKVNKYKYEFNIKNLIYDVEVTESTVLSTNEKIVEIKFKLMNNPIVPNRSNFTNDAQYQIALKKNQIGITGTGNSRKVFGKVLASIVNILKELKPNYVTFTADEANRQSLYLKLIGLVQKYMPFEFEKLSKNPLTNDELNPEEFWLKIKL